MKFSRITVYSHVAKFKMQMAFLNAVWKFIFEFVLLTRKRGKFREILLITTSSELIRKSETEGQRNRKLEKAIK